MRILRLLLVITGGIAGYAIGHFAPSLVTNTNIWGATTVFGVVWTLQMLLLTKLSSLSALEGLTETEQERLAPMLGELRHRMWHVGGVSLGCMIGMCVFAALADKVAPTMTGMSVGAMLGAAASYLILVPKWSEEIQRFTDKAKFKEVQRKRMERVGKELRAQ